MFGRYHPQDVDTAVKSAGSHGWCWVLLL